MIKHLPSAAPLPARKAGKPARPPLRANTTHADRRGQAVSAGYAALARAFAELDSDGSAAAARTRKISARVNEVILAAAAEKLGMQGAQISDIVTASLAMAAAPDRFKVWLSGPRSLLSDDFEPAV